jgi:flagellar basal-body rod protein FlgB
MWSSLLNSTALPALEQTVNFSQKRHLLLASNLANLDTPDYQTRDISIDNFQDQLRTAISRSHAPVSKYGPPIETEQANFEQVRDVSKQILLHDGSDVSLEQQVTEISKNQAMHNTAIALMRSQFQTLKVAITESVNV